MPDQPRLIEDEAREPALTAEEKAEYVERLRRKLQDPEFRQIEGFPLGDDEAILELSDPPYYTACANPFLPEIIERWQQEREQMREELGLRKHDKYHREPFATDVSEGKAGYVYSAHSYHTKVPYKAVMRYILHYTEPGDIIYDGFCGTGMAGVAAQMCGDREEVTDLGYRVDGGGAVYEGGERISHLGVRKTVLNDLSPIATFIAYNYNTPVDIDRFEREALRILDELEDEYGWMYETWHPHHEHPERVKARVRFTVWSEVLLCPECTGEIVFVDEALDPETEKVMKEFDCPHCGITVSKRDLEKYEVAEYDPVLGRTVSTLKREPVLIEYEVGDERFVKRVDAADEELIERIAQMQPPSRLVADEIPYMHMTHERATMANYGVTHLHHFLFPRARHTLTELWVKAKQVRNSRTRAFLLFAVEQAIWTMSLLNRYRPTGYSQVNQYLAGVYYIASQLSEISPWYVLEGKVDRLVSGFRRMHHLQGSAAITTCSAAAHLLPDESIDYIFTDPPFGENIYYADLNFFIESWHNVLTNSEPEAIIDRAKNKKLLNYQNMMRDSFSSFYRSLKPGRWMTVEFHNSHNRVWNSIQEALLSAGFVVADVRTLDRQQGSYRQVTAASAAKQDLIISAYRPVAGFEEEFSREAGTEHGAWEFVRQHLAQLPVVVHQNGAIETLSERQDYLLFDRMVAFHIQRGATVPLSAAEFYAGLRERFVERDGMFFLPDQVLEYDRARLEAEEVAQLKLFVDDEKSTIQWLRQELSPEYGGERQTYQEIQPKFLKQLHQARHEDLPELSEILEQNFLQDEQERWYVPDPSKASDLEKLRQKALLREFDEYTKGKKKLKQFRTEAVRAGFAQAWQERDYQTIVDVADRLPEDVLQEDPDLLMYYDNASLRV